MRAVARPLPRAHHLARAGTSGSSPTRRPPPPPPHSARHDRCAWARSARSPPPRSSPSVATTRTGMRARNMAEGMRVRRRCVHDGLVAWAQVRVPALLLLRPWCRVGRRRLRRTRHRCAPLPVHARLCRPPRRISAHLPRGDHACLAPRRHRSDAVRRHPHAPRLRDVLQPARRGAAAQPLDHAPPVDERRILCAGRVREIARDRLHGPPRAA